jgi:glycosyltransferase involved in cell wall biosynthesis
MQKKNNLKVIHISRGFCDYVIEFANAMSEKVEFHCVLSSKDEWIERELRREVIVYKSKAPRVNNICNIISLYKTYNYIKNIRPNIIHMQNGVIWELLLIKILKNIPFIITIHDVTKHLTRNRYASQYHQQYFLDYGVKNAKGIIAHGNKMLEKTKSWHNHRKSSALYENIDHGIISRYGSSNGSEIPINNIVLLFGSIDAYKGVEYFIEAEKYVRQVLKDVTFVIAGHTNDPAYYKRIVESQQNIELKLRRQSDSEVHDLFSSADVLVLPYIEASQSGVLQLGFSFCLPSVVTNVGGLPDIIVNKMNGLIVEKRNSFALAKGIIELLTNINLRKRVIANMKEQRANRFNWSNIADKTVRMYNVILSV